jgi:hypothetical protein
MNTGPKAPPENWMPQLIPTSASNGRILFSPPLPQIDAFSFPTKRMHELTLTLPDYEVYQ